MTFVKNPSYWQYDVRYPQNQLPYIDKVIYTVIPDLSTRIAALETGRVDIMGSIPINQFKAITGANPNLIYREMLNEASVQIAWRSDIPPFSNNIKFRQALSMAIDRQSIIDNLFEGHAAYSAARCPPSWPEFIPLDQYPEDVQKNFRYDPVAAKALLTEAGFPNGYTLEVIISSSDTDGLNMLQMIKANWATALNVTMNIKVMDPVQAQTLQLRHTFAQGYYSPSGLSYPSYGFSFLYQPDNTFRVYNVGNLKDPVYNAKYEAYINSYALPWDQRYPYWKDLCQYVRETCISTDMPLPNQYLFWQPWLKGHWGQSGMNYNSSGDKYKYMWIDKSK